MLSHIIFLNKKASIGFFFQTANSTTYIILLLLLYIITLYLHLFNISFKDLPREKPIIIINR